MASIFRPFFSDTKLVCAYYKPGKVSTGFEIWIAENHFNTDYSQYRAKISFDDSTLPHERCMIVCMNPDHTYEVQFNADRLKVSLIIPEWWKSPSRIAIKQEYLPSVLLNDIDVNF